MVLSIDFFSTVPRSFFFSTPLIYDFKSKMFKLDLGVHGNRTKYELRTTNFLS